MFQFIGYRLAPFIPTHTKLNKVDTLSYIIETAQGFWKTKIGGITTQQPSLTYGTCQKNDRKADLSNESDFQQF